MGSLECEGGGGGGCDGRLVEGGGGGGRDTVLTGGGGGLILPFCILVSSWKRHMFNNEKKTLT